MSLLNKTKEIIKLHTINNLSTRQIAKKMGYKNYNSVIRLLKYHKVLKKSLGYDEEIKVFNWLKKQGLKVQRQRGDAYFDLLLNKEKIDVKSSNLNKDKRYSFQIRNDYSLNKNLNLIDWFYLLFDREILYKVKPSELIARRNLHISNPDKSKYNLIYVGNLS